MKSKVNVYSKNRTALYYSIQYNHFSIFIIQSVGEPLSDIWYVKLLRKKMYLQDSVLFETMENCM